MKKQYLKYIFAFVLVFVLLVPNKAFAITSSGGYTIESYDIDMIVNEDNTFYITERITTYFSTAKHRNIQENTVKKYCKKNGWNHIKKYSKNNKY